MLLPKIIELFYDCLNIWYESGLEFVMNHDTALMAGLRSMDPDMKIKMFISFLYKLEKGIVLNLKCGEACFPVHSESGRHLNTLPSLASRSLENNPLVTENSQTTQIERTHNYNVIKICELTREDELGLKLFFYLRKASICDIYISLFDMYTKTLRNSKNLATSNEKIILVLENKEDFKLILEDYSWLLSTCKKRWENFYQENKENLQKFIKVFGDSEKCQSLFSQENHTGARKPYVSSSRVPTRHYTHEGVQGYGMLDTLV